MDPSGIYLCFSHFFHSFFLHINYSLTTLIKKLFYCRIENRLDGTKISIRESCSDDSWIQIDSLSTTNFSWINFYGQKLLDICIHNHTKYFVNDVSVEENSEHCLELNPHTIIRLDILEFENVKILQFSNIQEAIDSERSSIMLVSYKGTSSSQDKIVRDTEPLELIIELGAVGTSLIDHQPKELLFLYLARVFISYSTGYFAGKASRYVFFLFGDLDQNMSIL